MFVKLLKQDFRSTWGLLSLLSLICVGASLVGSGLIRLMDFNAIENNVLRILLVLGFVTVFFYLIAYSLAAMFLLLGRFYKSRFTDEGYLTFTLPVSTHQILLSSFLNCALGLIFCMLVTVVSFCLFFFLGISELDGQRLEFMKLALEYLPSFVETVGLGNILLTLANIAASIVGEILCIMMSITAAAVLAKKHKVMTGILIYYGVQFLLSALSANYSLNGLLAQEFTQSIYSGLSGSHLLQMALLSVTSYAVMSFLTDQKLNLN